MYKTIAIIISTIFLLNGCVVSNVPVTPGSPQFQTVLDQAKADIETGAKTATLTLFATTDEKDRQELANKLFAGATMVETAVNTNVSIEEIKALLLQLVADNSDSDKKVMILLVDTLVSDIQKRLNINFAIELPTEKLSVTKELILSATSGVKTISQHFR